MPTGTLTLNAFGRETEDMYVEAAGALGSCAYTPYAGGPKPPLTMGQSWQIHYQEQCNGFAPIDYTQQGSVVDVESVTVPAGTFTALKLQSMTSWTDPSGNMHKQSTANWLDVATFHSVRQSITITIDGTPPINGYAISRLTVLESTS